MTILTKTVPISKIDLIKAISLYTSECFGAMRIANAFAGQRSDAWELVHNHDLVELLDEADRLDISLRDTLTAVEEKPVLHSPAYLFARGMITQEDYAAHRRVLQSSAPDRDERLREFEVRFATLGEIVA